MRDTDAWFYCYSKECAGRLQAFVEKWKTCECEDCERMQKAVGMLCNEHEIESLQVEVKERDAAILSLQKQVGEWRDSSDALQVKLNNAADALDESSCMMCETFGDHDCAGPRINKALEDIRGK